MDNSINTNHQVNLSADSNRITDVGFPINNNDVATKMYVDHHSFNNNNPHNITAEQLGASKTKVFTRDPSPTDDINKGYHVGSQWINRSTHDEYVCVDNEPNNAIWSSISNKILVSILSTILIINPTVLRTTLYFPWVHEDNKHFKHGKIVFDAKIDDTPFQLVIYSSKEDRTLLDTIIDVSGCQTRDFDLPKENTGIEFRVKRPLDGAINPMLYSLVLQFRT